MTVAASADVINGDAALEDAASGCVAVEVDGVTAASMESRLRTAASTDEARPFLSNALR